MRALVLAAALLLALGPFAAASGPFHRDVVGPGWVAVKMHIRSGGFTDNITIHTNGGPYQLGVAVFAAGATAFFGTSTQASPAAGLTVRSTTLPGGGADLGIGSASTFDLNATGSMRVGGELDSILVVWVAGDVYNWSLDVVPDVNSSVRNSTEGIETFLAAGDALGGPAYVSGGAFGFAGASADVLGGASFHVQHRMLGQAAWTQDVGYGAMIVDTPIGRYLRCPCDLVNAAPGDYAMKTASAGAGVIGAGDAYLGGADVVFPT